MLRKRWAYAFASKLAVESITVLAAEPVGSRARELTWLSKEPWEAWFSGPRPGRDYTLSVSAPATIAALLICCYLLATADSSRMLLTLTRLWWSQLLLGGGLAKTLG